MQSILSTVKWPILTILSFLPTKLPVGITEFNAWATSILDLSGRYAHEDDMRFAIATMVIHADTRHGALPKRYFVTRLRKAAANQVASQIFQDIKLKQQLAAEEAAKAAATASTESVAVADGQASSVNASGT